MPGAPTIGPWQGSGVPNRGACMELCLAQPDCNSAVYWDPLSENLKPQCSLYSEPHTDAVSNDEVLRPGQEVLYCAPVGALATTVHCPSPSESGLLLGGGAVS